MTALRRDHTVLRKTAGGRDANGRWQEGVPTPITIAATVQPAQKADYDQMQALAEGRRVERMVRIYTGAELNVAGENASNGDLLLWDGDQYLVVGRSAWKTTMLAHNRYLAARVEPEPEQ